MKELYLCAQIDKVIKNEMIIGNIKMPSKMMLEQSCFTINVNKEIKSLKIHKNIAYQYVHFKGIYIYKKNDMLIGPDECPGFTMTYGELYNPLKFGEFNFNKIYEPYYLHTKGYKEDNYVNIIFNNAIYVDKIKIYTRNDTKEMSYRANSLIVEITDTDNHKYEIFNYLSLIEEFSEFIVKKLGITYCHNLFSIDDMNLVTKIILSFRNDCYYALSNYIHKLNGTDINIYYVSRYINEVILANSKLKYFLSFGLRDNYFLTYSDLQKKSYLTASLYVISVLKEICPNVSFCFGSLLGFVREPNGFIPHDYDLDIMICFDSNCADHEKYSNQVYELLVSKNVTVLYRWPEIFHVSYLNSTRFDIFVFFQEGNNINIGSPKRVDMEMNDLFPTIDIDILGVSCPIPRNPFKYLSKVYGSNWRQSIDKDVNITMPQINCNEVIELYEHLG